MGVKLLTARELARLLSLSVETIWAYTREKKIPAVTLGKRQYRYDPDEVMRALNLTPGTHRGSALSFKPT